jgi:hypothetical protein
VRCDWQTDLDAPIPCRVIDLDTGKQITFCAMADEETGEYVQYMRDSGKYVFDPETGQVKKHHGHARLKIQILKDGEPYLLEPETS